jgi:hypothetical protein
MENISHINSKICRPWEIKIHPYLYDHNLEGKAIFPAVEALITLACAVRANFPQAWVDSLEQASFKRFLMLPADARTLEVTVELQRGDGSITAALLTESKTKKVNIRRRLEHARVKFSTLVGSGHEPHSFYDLKKLKGGSINVPAVSIYRELVPFGRAYQNIEGDLSVSVDGALAYLSGGGADANDDILGSPFPFDAVMHAACVWGQRFTGIAAEA